MPGTFTYPGVYIEEISSGVHTITGVSTSDTAFIDFFPRGPVNQATRITSFGDFQRQFGGLDTRSEASYALQQFYLNGGSVAWVVRVTAGAANTASLVLNDGYGAHPTLTVTAISPGVWASNALGGVQVAVDHNTLDPAHQFNLAVREVATVNGQLRVVTVELHRNLTMDKTSAQYAVSVVNDASNLVQLTDSGAGTIPQETTHDVTTVISQTNPPSGSVLALAGTPNDGDVPGSSQWNSSGAGAIIGDQNVKTGIYALDKIAPFIFNILCIPAAANLPDTGRDAVYTAAENCCEVKRAFLIADIPATVDTPAKMTTFLSANPMAYKNAAIYFPRVQITDALNSNRQRNAPPSGTLAGVYSRTDAARGIWKAPAGTDASLAGAAPAVIVNDLENGALNQLGINVLRNFPVFGNVSWGARTLVGADMQASEWKYVPVRRTALYIEESLYEGLQWVVFEPNDERLWSQIRLNAGAFMQNLFRQGAFQGTTPAAAYFVKCDSETTTQNDIDRGVVNILVGFAPLKPAEFVVISIEQIAGQVQA